VSSQAWMMDASVMLAQFSWKGTIKVLLKELITPNKQSLLWFSNHSDYSPSVLQCNLYLGLPVN
jgi:hypothetical protein